MKEKNGEHPFGDAGQLIFLVLFLVVWILDSFFLRKSTFLSDIIPQYVRLGFLGIDVVAVILLVKLGHVAVIHDKQPSSFVSSGAFRYVRHPLYLGSILFYLGLAISSASLFSLLVLVVIFTFYDYIASYEERLMEVRFGGEYRDYKERTGKWVPIIGSKIKRARI